MMCWPACWRIQATISSSLRTRAEVSGAISNEAKASARMLAPGEVDAHGCSPRRNRWVLPKAR